MRDDTDEFVRRSHAKLTLQFEMKRRGISSAELTKRLNEMGYHENERNLRNKIARGTFPATFMIDCFLAMEARYIDLHYAHEEIFNEIDEKLSSIERELHRPPTSASAEGDDRKSRPAKRKRP